MTFDKNNIIIESYGVGETRMLPKKIIPLANIAEGRIDVLTCNIATKISDVSPENSVMGLAINHIHTDREIETRYGKGFRLSVNEKFILKENDDNNETYSYIDENGEEFLFKEYFYYLTNYGTKIYKTNADVDIRESHVTVANDGKMYMGANQVFAEYRNSLGVRVVAKQDALKDIKYFEQRSDELKQAEDKKANCEYTFNDYVIYDTEEKSRVASLINSYSTTEAFDLFIGELNSENRILTTKSEASYLDSLYSQLIAEPNENEVIENERIMDTINENVAKYKDMPTQAQLEKLYKDYVNLLEEIAMLNQHSPVNFLSNDKIVKGFNEKGDLVVVYDKHENYAVLEYEKYFDGEWKFRLARIVDNNEKAIVFNYGYDNRLASVSDIYDNKVYYEYNSTGELTKIKHGSGNVISLNYSGNNITYISNAENYVATALTYENGFLSGFYQHSLIERCEHGNFDYFEDRLSFGTVEVKNADEIGFFREIKIIVDGDVDRYIMYNAEASFLHLYVKEKDGLVVNAERYEYVPYWNGTIAQTNPHKSVVKANKSCLFVPYENFNFVDGDSEITTFDQYEKPSQTVSTSGVGTSRTVTNTVQYVYDKNQTLVEEIATETFSNSATEIVRHKKYTYNAYGEIVKTESYVEGEIYTNGKTIEETVYNDKGNVIRAFTYNSLDPSSKFYTEYVVDDKGKTLAELDGTGENKTEYIYDDKNRVIGEKFPNGSTLSYGHDESGEIVAITQSTEDGVENSTQKHYTCGELTRVESGNNTIDYTYDAKRRIDHIDLNGAENYLKYEYNEETDANGKKFDMTTVTNAKGETSKKKTSKLDGKTTYLEVGSDYASFTYDDKRKLTNVVQTMMDIPYRTHGYVYNDQDQITSYEEKEGDTVKLSETKNYNDDGQVVSKSIYSKDAVTTQSVSYSYSEDSTKMPSSISSSGLTIYPKYDKLRRNKGKKVECYSATLYDENIVYKKVGDHATCLPATVCRKRYSQYDNSLSSYSTTKYEYDNMGNIVKIIIDDTIVCRYEYDALNRLIREDNKDVGKTYLFYYDNNGNIVNKKVYAFTLKEDRELDGLTCNTISYSYEGDKLVNYNGQAIGYDEMGCPTSYKGKTLTWSNGRLTSYGGHTFNYDTIGRRLKKNNYGCFYDSEGKLVRYRDMQFIYDETGVIGYHELGATYAFVKDAQGNIIELLAPNGYIIARYVYDAWGNCKVVDTNGNEITNDNNEGYRNPIRYRGYFYDVETGLYFLKSRYYDPETGRFISPDGVEYVDPEIINGLNLYAYCGNNPVMNVDPEGHFFWLFLIGLAIGAASGAISYVGEVLINGIVYGDWSWSWGEFLGSTIGGAIGGIFMWTPFASFAMGAAVEAGSMIGSNIAGETNYTIGQILFNSFVAGGLSYFSGKFMRNYDIKGINVGRNSINAIKKQIVKKIQNNMIKRLSLRTGFKILISEIFDGLASINWGVAYDKIMEQIRQ